MRMYLKKAVGGAVLCLAVWLVFAYVSLSRFESPRPPGRPDRPDPEKFLSDRIDALERDLGRNLKANKEVLQDIKRRIADIKSNVPKGRRADDDDRIAVIVLACNRITVRRCLDSLIKYRPDGDRFPIVVSQDCDHEPTRKVLESYADSADSGISLIFQPDTSEIAVPPREKKFRGYFNIARHYRFALNHTFYELGHRAAIVVEDDLDVSPDFFEYFEGALPLLRDDPTLWCVSAWNDNGKMGLIDQERPDLLHRTDFFPGLGWMLLKTLWDELQPKWPASYWDDWIRKPEQRNGRACIRPELPRSMTFGKIGVSNGLFFEKYLKLIRLNEHPVAFTQMDLSHLTKETYDKKFIEDIRKAENVTLASLRTMADDNNHVGASPPSVRLIYSTKDEYKRAVRQLGLMEDFRSGVGRTAYLGVVSCYYKGHRVYITPPEPHSNYDPTWN